MSGSYRSSRGSMTSRGNRGPRTPKTPLQNVAVMIDQIVLAKTGGKSTPYSTALAEKSKEEGKILYDYADVFLLHDIEELGLRAEWGGENGDEPQTKMRLMMPMPYDRENDRPQETLRRDLQGLTVKKAGGPPMGHGSTVMFEKVWTRDGELFAHFSRGGPTADDINEGLKQTFTNVMLCVLPEPPRFKDGKPMRENGEIVMSGRQEALIADPLDGVIISSEEELVQKVQEMLDNASIGSPGFQLHARDVGPEVDYTDLETRCAGFAIAKPRPKDPKAAEIEWVQPTAEEVVERFWKQWPTLAERFGQEGVEFEFVPMMSVAQAKTLTPSDRRNEKGRDNSKLFRIYEPNEQGILDPEKPTDVGWALGHVTVERMSADSEVYYATYENLASTRSKTFYLPDMPTAHMIEKLPGHYEAVEKEAARLVENRVQAFRSKGQSHTADQEQGAEPPTPGM